MLNPDPLVVLAAYKDSQPFCSTPIGDANTLYAVLQWWKIVQALLSMLLRISI